MVVCPGQGTGEQHAETCCEMYQGRAKGSQGRDQCRPGRKMLEGLLILKKYNFWGKNRALPTTLSLHWLGLLS